VSAELQAWFTARLPATWFTGPPEILVDRDEIVVIGTLPDASAAAGAGASAEACGVACAAAAKSFREATRDDRMRIAAEAEHRFGRTVSWGVRVGDVTALFTTASVPVMTRLRLGERQVLDTLIAAGVARSRSEALAWCVRLVGQHTSDWLSDLRVATEHVKTIRDQGPSA
jgi:hypothetical protein